MAERDADTHPAEIAWRGEISRGLDRLANRMDRMGESLGELSGDVRERLSRIENSGLAALAADNQRKIEECRRDIDALQSDKDRRDGGLAAANWIIRYAPWAVTIVMAALAIVAWDRILQGGG